MSADYIGYYAIDNAGQLIWFEKLVNGTLSDGTAKNENANAVLTNNITLNNETFVFEPDTGLIKVTGEAVAYLGTGIKGNGSGANEAFDTTASTMGPWYTLAADGYETTYAYSGTIRVWTPIDNYSGIFDGNGKTVSGLYINGTADRVGLFGMVTGTVKNLGVINSYIRGSSYVGAVGGKNNGSFEGCYNAGFVGGDLVFIGGVVGLNSGTVKGCYNAGYISGNNYVGGVAGKSEGNSISGCYNIGTVIGYGYYTYVGGVCGCIYFADLTDCYNIGTVSGYDDGATVGGVCGDGDGTYGKISNCYNIGTVSGVGEGVSIGGICGTIDSCEISNCYYLADSETDSIDGTTFKTSAQFASGEVAWLLQDAQTDKTVQTWGQVKLGEATPILTSDARYAVRRVECGDTPYYNTNKLYGDINNDMKVDYDDLTRLLKASVGIGYSDGGIDSDAAGLALADLNSDGTIDAIDAAMLEMAISGGSDYKLQ
ncbi:MAG: hypothetical protein GX051_00460 [Clostridiales bacterium]|nr:hypothetical protein [Clostridiales bacterium]